MHGGEARLVGRQRELASLESALEEARDGRGLMVALVGEPGIGKSRLALEMRQRAEASRLRDAPGRARGRTHRRFRITSSASSRRQLLDRAPGQSTADALRSARGDRRRATRWADGPRSSTRSSARASDDDPQLADLSPSGRQRILVHAIGGLLKAASQREPMLVVLDDLHWADPASLAVVEELLDILPGLRVVLMATYRSNWSHGWEGRSAYEQLNLRALRPEDAREMAEELAAGRSVPEELTERVLERSAGNPLFLEELLHGERGGTDGQPHRLPATIHEMLLARLDALPPEARRTLQLASVVGMEFSEGTVVALSDARRRPDRCGAPRPPARRARRRRRPRAHARLPSPAHPRGRLRQPPAQHAARAARSHRPWIEEHGGEERIAELARHYRDSDDPAKAARVPAAGRRAGIDAEREPRGLRLVHGCGRSLRGRSRCSAPR